MSSFGQAFYPERGDYQHGIQQINEALKAGGLGYLFLKPEKVLPHATYRLNLPRNEYQVKDWFQKDWYSLQDMFGLDFAAFLDSEGATTFNQAKRRQYRKFAFDKKKFYHHKSVPTMREWGGLTHPPVKKLDRPLEDFHGEFAPLNYKNIQSSYFDPELQNQIDNASRSELTFDNSLQALEDIDAYHGKKWLITKARESILMSSLVFVCDKSTRKIVELLIEKHREGVKVRVMVDGFISKLLHHRECPQIMRRAGIEVMETKGFFKHKGKAIYHTKTLVIDNAEAIAGGQNMIDADNTSRGTDFKNRDIDLYVQGPMVSDISRQFMENWNYYLKTYGNEKGKLSSMDHDYHQLLQKLQEERDEGLRGRHLYQKILGSPETRMRGVCRFIKQAPHEDRHTVGKAYLLLLDKLSRYLVITDPIKADTVVERKRDLPLIDRWDSFDMFNQLHLKVQQLARSGKKLDYITTNIDMAGNENVAMMNERIKEQLEEGQDFRANWSFLKLFASNKYYGGDHYRNLLHDWAPIPSVNVWTHISFMHSKIFYFDRIVASIGSVNFQHNATDQAYESTSICMDDELNRQLDRILVTDMANSIPLIYSDLR